MLQINPIERYQTAEDVINELNKLEQKDWQTEEEDATVITTSKSKKKSNKYGMFTAIIVIILFNIMLAGVWYFFFPEKLFKLIDKLQGILPYSF